jgi:hypothetical protein
MAILDNAHQIMGVVILKLVGVVDKNERGRKKSRADCQES